MTTFLWILLYFGIGFVIAIIYAEVNKEDKTETAKACTVILFFWPMCLVFFFFHGIELFFYWLVERL